MPNTNAELSPVLHPQRDVNPSLQHELTVADFNESSISLIGSLKSSRRLLIKHSAHDPPPSLGCFARLGSPQHNLYRMIRFDKLHVLDLGLIRQFCNLTNTLIHTNYILSLARLMATMNDRYIALPAQSHLSRHTSYCTSTNYSQAGLSGKYRSLSEPFLWCTLIGVSDVDPDSDPLLQCPFKLYCVSTFLSDPICLNDSSLAEWYEFMFQFAKEFSELFSVDIGIRMHRRMRHVKSHIDNIGCLRRASSEENESAHKEYKVLYNNIIRQMESIAPQLVTCWVERFANADESDAISESNSETQKQLAFLEHSDSHSSETWSQFRQLAISAVEN